MEGLPFSEDKRNKWMGKVGGLVGLGDDKGGKTVVKMLKNYLRKE